MPPIARWAKRVAPGGDGDRRDNRRWLLAPVTTAGRDGRGARPMPLRRQGSPRRDPAGRPAALP